MWLRVRARGTAGPGSSSLAPGRRLIDGAGIGRRDWSGTALDSANAMTLRHYSTSTAPFALIITTLSPASTGGAATDESAVAAARMNWRGGWPPPPALMLMRCVL